MSSTRDVHHTWLTHHILNHRIVAELEEKVIERSGENALFRLFHAKSDKIVIAAWKEDLKRILHVFNVRSVILAWLSLIDLFQSKLIVGHRVSVSEQRINY